MYTNCILIVFLNKKIEALRQEIRKKANAIPVLPDIVTIDKVKKEIKNITNLPLGIFEKSLKIGTYNFKTDFINIITARDISVVEQFIDNLLKEIELLKDIEIFVFDAERISLDSSLNIEEEYQKFIYNVGKNSSNKQVLGILIGVDKVYYKVSEFNQTLKKIEEKGNCNFIFGESVIKLKNHEYDEWFKNYISKDNSIWVGSGLNNQYLITINSDRRKIKNNCGNSYGYIIKQGEAHMIKLLNMKDDGDENEQ